MPGSCLLKCRTQESVELLVGEERTTQLTGLQHREEAEISYGRSAEGNSSAGKGLQVQAASVD